MLFRRFALAPRVVINPYSLRTSVLVVIALCLSGWPVLGQEWEEPTEESFKLTASDVTPRDRFG